MSGLTESRKAKGPSSKPSWALALASWHLADGSWQLARSFKPGLCLV